MRAGSGRASRCASFAFGSTLGLSGHIQVQVPCWHCFSLPQVRGCISTGLRPEVSKSDRPCWGASGGTLSVVAFLRPWHPRPLPAPSISCTRRKHSCSCCDRSMRLARRPSPVSSLPSPPSNLHSPVCGPRCVAVAAASAVGDGGGAVGSPGHVP